jgi:hypothetical protein
MCPSWQPDACSHPPDVSGRYKHLGLPGQTTMQEVAVTYNRCRYICIALHVRECCASKRGSMRVSLQRDTFVQAELPLQGLTERSYGSAAHPGIP